MKNSFVDSEFFVIDRDNLESVKTRLYGYTIINDQIITHTENLYSDQLTGLGAYLYVERKGNLVSIYQDFIGCYGLFIYKNNSGYYAISNSLIKLIEYLNTKVSLTINRDYAEYMIAADVCSSIYQETIINEIEILDREVIVEISLDSRDYHFLEVNYKENTVDPDSDEGIRILDDWADRWSRILENICSKTSNLLASLSGGFDSRLAFSLLLYSKIDLSKIFVYSINDGKYVHPEDYEIASAIAKKFHFTLNNSDYLDKSIRNETIDEVMNRSFYTKLFFHKQMYYLQDRETTKYSVFGSGGECLRSHWEFSPEAYINKKADQAAKFSSELSKTTQRILKESLQKVSEKYAKLGKPLDDEDLVPVFYKEARCRNHFGRNAVEAYLSNSILLYPLLDPMLNKLRLSNTECGDKNLLITLIFLRYAPELLEFKFDSGKAIDEKTIHLAVNIIKKYPLPNKQGTKTVNIPAFVKEDNNVNSRKTSEIADLIMVKAFKSEFSRKVISGFFNDEIYSTILNDLKTRSHYPVQNAYLPLGLVKLLCMLQDSVAPHGEFANFYIALSETESINIDIPDSDVSICSADKDTITAYNDNLGITLSWNQCYKKDTLNIYRKSGTGIKCIAAVKQDICCYVDTEVKDNCWGKVYSYFILPCNRTKESEILSYFWIQRLSSVVITAIEEDEAGNVILNLETDNGNNKAAGYEIQYSSRLESFTNEGTWDKIVVSGRNTNRIILSTLIRDTIYYFRVRAYSDYKNRDKGITKRSWSSYSPVVSYHTKGVHNIEKKKRKFLRKLV